MLHFLHLFYVQITKKTILILDNLGKKFKVLIPFFFILSNNVFTTAQSVASQMQESSRIFISL